jgi:hypothetical protein
LAFQATCYDSRFYFSTLRSSIVWDARKLGIFYRCGWVGLCAEGEMAWCGEFMIFFKSCSTN